MKGRLYTIASSEMKLDLVRDLPILDIVDFLWKTVAFNVKDVKRFSTSILYI